jgi:predicted dehydrogenase
MNNTEHHRYGAYFYGTEGILHIGWRDGWTFYPVKKNGTKAHGDPRFDNERDGHNVPPLWADFIEAIEKKRKPVADIEPSHRSSVLPMLGMISYKLGRSLEWDGRKEKIIGDNEANKLLRRDYRKPWVYPKI